MFSHQEKPTEAKKAKKDENGTAPEAEDAGDEEADDEEIEGEDEEYGDEGGKNFLKTRQKFCFLQYLSFFNKNCNFSLLQIFLMVKRMT